ncbi:MAG: hypothetical protein P1U72_00870 [Paracoccaceae bacterium]|nr:hypothetical protein [Paracoccaceae bacterium]
MKITKPMHLSSPEELLQAICAPDVLPDEKADKFEYLRQALFQDLEPKSPYEQLLAEQMVALEWDAVRYRRLRDNLLKGEFRELSKGVFALGAIGRVNPKLETEKSKAQALDLVAQDNDRRQSALNILADMEIQPSEIMAKAYQQVAKDLEVFERQIAETETRRRKLRDDYDRLRAARTKHVEDAEVIEP